MIWTLSCFDAAKIRKHLLLLHDTDLRRPPEICEPPTVHLDRLSFVFDVKSRKKDEFARKLATQFPEKQSTFREEIPFRRQYRLTPYLHLMFAPTMGTMWMSKKTGTVHCRRYARLDLSGRAFGRVDRLVSTLHRMYGLVNESAVPETFELTRCDVALDYTYDDFALLVCHDTSPKLRTGGAAMPRDSSLMGAAVNQIHGSRRRRRVAYAKAVQILDWLADHDNRLFQQLSAEAPSTFALCRRVLGDPRLREVVPEHLVGASSVLRLEAAVCPQRCEGRRPEEFFQRTRNPFGTYELIHLGAVPKRPDWVLPFLWSRYDGSIAIRQALREYGLGREFDRRARWLGDRFERHNPGSSPRVAFENERGNLQAYLDTVFRGVTG